MVGRVEIYKLGHQWRSLSALGDLRLVDENVGMQVDTRGGHQHALRQRMCGQEVLLVIDHHQHHQQNKRQGNCRAQGGFWINPACCAALLSVIRGEAHQNRPKKERRAPISTVGGCVNPPSGPPIGPSGGVSRASRWRIRGQPRSWLDSRQIASKSEKQQNSQN